MSRWKVTITECSEITVEVEADDPFLAEDAAYDLIDRGHGEQGETWYKDDAVVVPA